MLFFMASTLDLDPSRLGRRNTYIFIIEGIPLATGVFPSDQVTFPLTRNSALARLQAFLPLAGSRYARMRNLDQGPNGHVHVSRLSAALAALSQGLLRTPGKNSNPYQRRKR